MVGSYRGRGHKPRMVVVSASLIAQLRSYAYEHNLPPEDKLFPFSRVRAWQILHRAFEVADIPKPEHVGSVRVLRHSGAIARLAETDNPKACRITWRARTPP